MGREEGAVAAVPPTPRTTTTRTPDDGVLVRIGTTRPSGHLAAPRQYPPGGGLLVAGKNGFAAGLAAHSGTRGRFNPRPVPRHLLRRKPRR